jgi:hypothetical protein
MIEPSADVVDCRNLIPKKHYYMKIKFIPYFLDELEEEQEELEEEEKQEYEGKYMVLKVEFIAFYNDLINTIEINPEVTGRNDTLSSNECLAYFRVLRIVSSNVRMTYFNFEYTVNDLIYAASSEANPAHTADSSEIKNYYKPGKLMWVILGRNDTIEITQRMPVIPKEEDTPIIERFLSLFPDYPGFIEFLNNNLSAMSPLEYDLYYRHMSPLDFTTRAPAGYSFLEIPRDATISSNVLGLYEDYSIRVYPVLDFRQPFYAALKYIFSIINHFSPSVEREGIKKSEQSYFIMLDRLIYYYNIYNNIANLSNTEDTAVIAIFTHGGYMRYSDHESVSRDTNLFICTKSSPGSFAVNMCEAQNLFDLGSISKISETMYRNIETNSFISFDKVILEHYEVSIPRIQANPRIETNQFAKSMQHYINPQIHRYKNKRYTTDKMYHNVVLDVIEFGKMSGSAEDRISNLNLLSDPEFKKYMRERKDIEEFTLKNIINYYIYEKQKKNIFVYDFSCGSIDHEPPADIMKVADYLTYNDYVEEDIGRFVEARKQNLTDVVKREASIGFGRKPRTRKTRKTRKTRRTRKNKRHR